MEPLVQKLPLDNETSFIARTFRTPDFEVGWHRHIEYELILFTEGSGLSFIGNHIGEFETGDIYFLGSNLPHTFQKRAPDIVTAAVVVQFRDDFWGSEFLQLPENRQVRQLLAWSAQGLKLRGPLKSYIRSRVSELESATGLRRITVLCDCLERMATEKEWARVTTQQVAVNNDERLNKVFQFTIDHFKDPLTLSMVAQTACMSIQHFCSFFKRSTQKTYIDFLNEVRVGFACTLLADTQKSVLDICYECGYNTVTHFHKQFLKIKKMTPLQYRKSFSPDVIRKGRNIGIV